MNVKSGRWCVPRVPYAEVPTAVHAEQFVPLLVEHFGDDWWRRGTLSLLVASTIVPREPVRCHLESLPGERCRVWMNAEGEALILSGTASVEDNPVSELLEVLAGETVVPASRVLPGILAGEESPPRPLSVAAAEVDARLPTITEPMPPYRDGSTFGGRVVPPASLAEAVQGMELESAQLGVERLERGLEIRYLNGPLLCDSDYQVRRQVLGLSGSARDETMWYQLDVELPDGRVPVARLIRMDRFAPPGVPLAHSAQR